jgi:hypothetical protein
MLQPHCAPVAVGLPPPTRATAARTDHWRSHRCHPNQQEMGCRPGCCGGSAGRARGATARGNPQRKRASPVARAGPDRDAPCRSGRAARYSQDRAARSAAQPGRATLRSSIARGAAGARASAARIPQTLTRVLRPAGRAGPHRRASPAPKPPEPAARAPKGRGARCARLPPPPPAHVKRHCV